MSLELELVNNLLNIFIWLIPISIMLPIIIRLLSNVGRIINSYDDEEEDEVVVSSEHSEHDLGDMF